MILLILLLSVLSTIILLISSLAYASGNYLLCDMASWAGWGGVIIVLFIILGTIIIKSLVNIAPLIFRYLPFLSDLLEGSRAKSDRRRVLKYTINICLIAVSSYLAVHVLFEALRIPQVKEVNIEIENLPSDLEGIRIVQITDLHISPAIRRNYVQKLVERVNDISPDIIALTGDIFDDLYDQISEDVAPLAGLNARLGIFFVTGNHEYFHRVDNWLIEIEKLGLTVLLNEHKLIKQGRGLILVGGVADYSAPSRNSHASDPFKAIGEFSEADVKILLAHQPLSVYEAAQAGFDLQLSGHTHGGIISLARWLKGLEQPFQSGLYTYKSMKIYVSNGAGYYFLPVRFGSPSEISLLKLTGIKSA